MSELIRDNGLVEAIYQASRPGIRAVLKHPATGAPVNNPGKENYAAKAALANVYLFNPEFVLVWSKTMTYSHLDVWRNYIQRSQRRFAIVCPSMKGNDKQRGMLSGTPFWPADEGFKAARSLPAAPACSALLYPTNDRNNVPFISHLPRHLHVHINHGDSEKHSNANRFALAYDYLFVADARAIERFSENGVDVPRERFLPVGGTVLPGLKSQNRSNRISTVLYAPTFEGWQETTNYSSVLRTRDRIIEYASSRGECIYRPHHAMGARSAKYREASEEIVSSCGGGRKDKVDQFNRSDALIADISGVVNEYLFTGKPIIIPVVAGDGWIYEYLERSGLQSYCYVWDPSAQPLREFLDSIADDPLCEARLKRRSLLYHDARSFEDSLENFDRALRHLSETQWWRQVRRGASARTPELEMPAGLKRRETAVVKGIRAGEITLIAED